MSAAAVDSSSSGDTAAPLPGATSAAPPAPRRIPAPCWTHPETLALISAYRDKWYALRRGNLRAAHWQEVADAVSALSPAPTPKTAVQCRHKIEKLRKRYRADRLRSLSLAPAAPPASPWLYFRRMDAMERGVSSSDVSSSDDHRVTVAVPKRAAPAVEEDEEEDEEEDDPRARVAATTRSLQLLMANGNYRAKEEGEGEEEEEEDPRARVTATTRSLQHLMASSGVPGRRGVGGSKPAAEEMRRMERRRREEGGEMRGVVGAIRRLGDSFVRVEQMKIEMARDLERERMEMEMKRTEMVLDCQRWLAESWAKEFAGKKKRVKVTPDS